MPLEVLHESTWKLWLKSSGCLIGSGIGCAGLELFFFPLAGHTNAVDLACLPVLQLCNFVTRTWQLYYQKRCAAHITFCWSNEKKDRKKILILLTTLLLHVESRCGHLNTVTSGSVCLGRGVCYVVLVWATIHSSPWYNLHKEGKGCRNFLDCTVVHKIWRQSVHWAVWMVGNTCAGLLLEDLSNSDDKNPKKNHKLPKGN